MQLYSREAAEEQYRQQASQVPQYATDPNAPIPLGGGERQFDPAKSEALKAIQEQDRQRDEFLGYDFFDKVASAETPKVPPQQEPYWAEEARQRSDRARSHSQTPGGYYRYKTANWDDDDVNIPSGPPPVYTTGVTYEIGPAYNTIPRRRRDSDTRKELHSPVPGAAEHGYLFGGMDFIDHSQQPQYDPNDFEYGHVSRRDQQSRKYEPPGWKYGMDYNSSPQRYQGIGGLDAYYHGYAAEKPRKQDKYSADPKEPLNIAWTQSLDGVDPVRLVGDTLSNQHISYDRPLTEEEKRTYAAVFAPPTGFKPEHRTVRPEPKEPGPICFSVSAKKELASGNYETTTPASRSQSAHPFSTADSYWYTTGNKEIMRTEPNWARNVRQRKDAWGHLVQGSQSVVDHRPPWAKVPPPQQPDWAKRAHSAHGVWQGEVDRRGHGQRDGGGYEYNQNGTGYAQNGTTQTIYYRDPRDVNQQNVTSDYSIQQTQKATENYPQPQQYQYSNDQPGQGGYTVQQSQQRSEGFSQPQQHQYSYEQRSYQPPQQQGYQQQQQRGHQYQQYQRGLQQQQPVEEYGQSYNTQRFPQTNQSQSTTTQQRQQQGGTRTVTTTRTTNYTHPNQGPVQTVSVQSSSAVRPAPFPVENNVAYTYAQQTSPIQRTPGEVKPQTAYTSTRVENRVTSSGSGQPVQAAAKAAPQVPAKPVVRREEPLTAWPTHSERVEQTRTVNRTTTEDRRQQIVPLQQQPSGQRQVSQNNYQRYWKKETTEEQGRPAQVVLKTTEKPAEFDRNTEMAESLPRGTVANTFTNATGEYRDPEGRNIQYKRELSTATDPGREYQLLKEEERRIVDDPIEPGVVSRHIQTKYYKKKTVTENTANTKEG
ncbi:Protein PQN-22 c [Aphelenchoides avenae]|nr:Protein PQN-22 c [Aphelenchus avenae]